MTSNHLFLLPLAAAALSACGKTETARPNFLFILTDDHTTQAMSCYNGNLIETPHMDRIAAEGLRMDRLYATNALSGPSRASILTGKFSHKHGFTDNACVFDTCQLTFPKLFQENGYRTAMIGKWHLISEPKGFDFWSILSGQEEQGDYYRPAFCEMGREIEEEGYVTDILTDKAIEFIDRREDSAPFLLLLHHKAPHRNWMPAPRHLGIFNDRTFPMPETLFDDYSGRGDAAREQDMSIAHTLQEAWDLKLLTREEILAGNNRLFKVYTRMDEAARDRWDAAYAPRIAEYRSGRLQGRALTEWKCQQYLRDYLATVLAVDESIGRLLDHLEKTGELDRTVVIYASDQGFFLGEHGWFDKRFMYEECQRMPFVIRYPGLIRAGGHSDAICMNVDIAPTLLDLAGIPVPKEMQGRSFRPVLENDGLAPPRWRNFAYYHYYEYPAEHSVKRHYGLRTPRYKLIHFYNDIDQWELYDLAADPLELHNVHEDSAYTLVRGELHALLGEAQRRYGDTDPDEREKILFHGDRRLMDRKGTRDGTGPGPEK